MPVRTGPTAVRPGATLVRRAWDLPLWAHAAALTVVLVALLPLMNPTSSFTSDEGAYALQVDSLRSGTWEYDYKAAPLDPDGSYFPIILGDGTPDRYYPYVKHPVFSLLLVGTTNAFGQAFGLHLPGLLGVVAAAVAAWLLAAELQPRLSRPAFWLVATGPALISGYVVWAHAPSAAAAGFAVLGAVLIARRGVAVGPVALTVVAVVVGVLLRSEGLLFAGALAVGLVAVRLRPARALRAFAAGALIALPAFIAAKAEDAWIADIIGGAFSGQAVRGAGVGSGSFVEDRASGAWHELFQAHFVDSSAGPLVLLALVVAVGLGYVALRRWADRSRLLLAAGVGGAAVLLALRFAAHPHEAVTGLVAAWPLAILGLLFVRWRGSGSTTGLLGITTALFTAAVVATQYAEGGGLEWGGRFLSPVLVPIAVLATAGLARALDSIPADGDRRYATALLAGMAAVTAIFALATAGSLRAREDAIVAALERHPATVTVTTRPAYPRIAWRADDRLTWMLTDDARLLTLLEYLRLAGVDVNVVVSEDSPVFGEVVDEPALRDDGMKMVTVRSEVSVSRSD